MTSRRCPWRRGRRVGSDRVLGPGPFPSRLASGGRDAGTRRCSGAQAGGQVGAGRRGVAGREGLSPMGGPGSAASRRPSGRQDGAHRLACLPASRFPAGSLLEAEGGLRIPCPRRRGALAGRALFLGSECPTSQAGVRRSASRLVVAHTSEQTPSGFSALSGGGPESRRTRCTLWEVGDLGKPHRVRYTAS